MANIGDIATATRYLVDADTTSYSNANLLIWLNKAYEEVVAFILNIDGLWQFDDSRFTNFPIATTTLVNAQNDYTLDVAFLEIEGVSVKDNTGIWHTLDQIDLSQIPVDPAEYYKTNGMPVCYDKQGISVLLYPAPDNGTSVTLASGLKVFYKRTASVFTSGELTTGTTIPGFASPFHQLLAYKAALPFAQNYKQDRVPAILTEIARMEKGLKEFYGKREQDRRKILSPNGISFR